MKKYNKMFQILITLKNLLFCITEWHYLWLFAGTSTCLFFHFNTRLNMWEKSHKFNLYLGDLWTILTIEQAILSSWRQMGSATTERTETSWDTKPRLSPWPLWCSLHSSLDLYSERAGTILSVTAASICFRQAGEEIFLTLTIPLNRNCLGKALTWKVDVEFDQYARLTTEV